MSMLFYFIKVKHGTEKVYSITSTKTQSNLVANLLFKRQSTTKTMMICNTIEHYKNDHQETRY